MDISTLKAKILGCSYFPLFIDKELKRPVVAEDPRQNIDAIARTLHTGAYQMPIFYDFPEEKQNQPLTYRDYVSLERIPTASVLLRVDFASVDDDGFFISIKDADAGKREMAYEPPQDYNSGAYSTLYYIISEQERDLYAIRKKRNRGVSLLDLMQAAAQAKNKSFSTQSAIQNWIKGELNLPKNAQAYIDRTYFSEYEPKFGFRVEFNVLHGARPQRDSIYMVLASVCPPSEPYLKNRLKQAFTVERPDWNKSYPDFFVFDEGETSMQNIDLYPSSCFVFNVIRYSFLENESSDYGFAILPLATRFQHKLYMNSGVF